MNTNENTDVEYKIKVMQAYLNGQTIQIKTTMGWLDTLHPSWNWENDNYRIKIPPQELHELEPGEQFHFVKNSNYVIANPYTGWHNNNMDNLDNKTYNTMYTLGRTVCFSDVKL